MNAWAIVNPISGRRNVARRIEALRRELDSRGCRLTIVPTRGPGDARRIASEAPEDAHAVIAVGGDGTASDTAAGLVGRRVPLAVLPAGTENIVARHFRVPRNPATFAAMLVRGSTTTHDIGRLGDRPFLIMCGVGFDARVVEGLAESRTGHIGYVHYLAPLWRTFWEAPFPELVVQADGECVFQGRGLALVGVQPRYSLGLRILTHSVHNDGRLDLCIYPCASRRQLLGHAWRTLWGRHTDQAGVIYRKCQSVEITSPQRVPVQSDGDPAGVLPARFEVLPGALRLIVP